MASRTDMETMVKALKILELNSFNYSRTAEETGVSRQTLKKWASKLGVAVFKHTKIEETVEESNEDIEHRKVVFVKNVLATKELLLMQMDKVIPKCNDIDKLSRALKIVSDIEFIANNGSNPDHANSAITNTANFMQVIINTIKSKNKQNNEHTVN